MYRTLNASGYPLKPASIFVGIRREYLNGVDFVQAMLTGTTVSFPVRFIRRWKTFAGQVRQVHQFPDGSVVIIKPLPGSLVGDWPSAGVWGPRALGAAGVLI